MTMAPPDLQLLDIHEPAAPPWWPPAPGWWVLAGLVLLAVAFVCGRRWHRARRRQRALRMFDETVAAADTPVQRIAAMSELLRRAGRRRDPAADRLQGEAWLAFLDAGAPQPGFVSGAGRALLDGGFRREAGDVEMDALHRIARARFVDWMAPR